MNLQHVNEDELTVKPPKDGCEVYRICTQCPLAACRFDGEGGVWFYEWKQRDRSRAIALHTIEHGKQAAAVAFGITERSAWRLAQRLSAGELEPVLPPLIEIPPLANRLRSGVLPTIRHRGAA